MEGDAILALVTRLARPHASGGDVIERAAILAEGGDFPAVIAWIISHAGEPESAVASASTGGLHGSRLSGELVQVANSAVALTVPGIKESLRLPLAGLRSLVVLRPR